MAEANPMQAKELEYKELLTTYRNYFDMVTKGIAIYLAIIGACLTLPVTLRFDSPQALALFKEMCRIFAMVTSLGGVAAYAAGAVVFGRLNTRQKALAEELGIEPQDTWLLPAVVWLAIGVAVLLTLLIFRYA